MLLCIISAQKFGLRTAAVTLEQSIAKLKESTKLMAELCTLNDYYKDKLADREKQLAAVREQIERAATDMRAASGTTASVARRINSLLSVIDEPIEEQTNGPDSPTT